MKRQTTVNSFFNSRGEEPPVIDFDDDLTCKITEHGRLGAGAFSAVRLVYNNENAHVLALKMVPFADKEGVAALVGEISTLTYLNKNPHQFVVVAHAHGTYRGVYAALLIDAHGIDLNRILYREQSTQLKVLKCRDFFQITSQLFSVLVKLIEAGVAHSDLKPANIMVKIGEDGSVDIKVVDFGAAVALNSETLFCTPAYAEEDVLICDEHFDAFSVAIILKEMFTKTVRH
jgi:serine/threonine protein kinase